MNVIIEINGIRHKMINSGQLTYCESSCSLHHLCPGANPTTAQESLLKFCLMFPNDGAAHFERIP